MNIINKIKSGGIKSILLLIVALLILVGAGATIFSFVIKGNYISLAEASNLVLDHNQGSEIIEVTKKPNGLFNHDYHFVISKDNQFYDVKVNAKNGNTTSHLPNSTYSETEHHDIGYNKAKEIALEHIGGGKIVKSEVDFSDGRKEYEYTILHDGYKYELDIIAKTGEINDYSKEVNTNNSNNTSENEITAEQAKTIALEHVGGGTIRKFEIDNDYYYNKKFEIEIIYNGYEYDIDISPTGEIIKSEKELD